MLLPWRNFSLGEKFSKPFQKTFLQKKTVCCDRKGNISPTDSIQNGYFSDR